MEIKKQLDEKKKESQVVEREKNKNNGKMSN